MVGSPYIFDAMGHGFSLNRNHYQAEPGHHLQGHPWPSAMRFVRLALTLPLVVAQVIC